LRAFAQPLQSPAGVLRSGRAPIAARDVQLLAGNGPMLARASTILVPVDFGEASNHAFALAEELAGPLGAELVVLHVFVEPVVAYPGMAPVLVPGMSAEVEVAARRALAELVAKHPRVRPLLRTGEPSREILAAIASVRPRMVVMGTHGRKGIQRLFLGSVAQRIVRASPVPVLTVRVPDEA
jgi:nucleotide-binding universal stress UspA family protein